MIKRTPEHIIDTKAIRTVIGQLSHDWLIRNLDERDYGIDLTLERFNNEVPTGDFILLQIKGTDTKFSEDVKLSGFPVKTIQYSLLFNIPFFVVHVSNASNKAYFVWLQKYAETKLPRTTKDWQDQDTVTIYFPSENDLKNNNDKVIDIIDKDKSKKTGVKFLSYYDSLCLHSGSVVTGEYAVGKYCADVCWRIASMKSFVNRYSAILPDDGKPNINQLGNIYHDISQSLNITSEDIVYINSQLKLINNLKQAFLNDDELDDFAVEMEGFYPY
jgi:hypothetical protein